MLKRVFGSVFSPRASSSFPLLPVSELEQESDLLLLSDEIILRILTFCDYYTVCRVAQVCTILNILCKDNHLWRYFLEKEGWSFSQLTTETDFKFPTWEAEGEFFSYRDEFVSNYLSQSRMSKGIGRELSLYLQTNSEVMTCAATAGWWIVAGGNTGRVAAYKLKSLADVDDQKGYSLCRFFHQRLPTIPDKSPVQAVGVHPSGLVVGAFYEDDLDDPRCILVVWDAEMDTRQNVITLPSGPIERPHFVTHIWITDSYLVVNCGLASNIMVWRWSQDSMLVDEGSGTFVKDSESFKPPFSHMHVLEASRCLYVVALRHHIHIWKTKSNKDQSNKDITLTKYKSLNRHGGNIESGPFTCMNVNRGFLVAGTRDGAIHIWKLNDLLGTISRVWILKNHESSVTAIAVEPNRCVVGCGFADGHIAIWDLSTFESLLVQQISTSVPISYFIWHPHENFIVTSTKCSDISPACTVSVWKLSPEKIGGTQLSASLKLFLLVPPLILLTANKFGLLMCASSSSSTLLNFHPAEIPSRMKVESRKEVVLNITAGPGYDEDDEFEDEVTAPLVESFRTDSLDSETTMDGKVNRTNRQCIICHRETCCEIAKRSIPLIALLFFVLSFLVPISTFSTKLVQMLLAVSLGILFFLSVLLCWLPKGFLANWCDTHHVQTGYSSDLYFSMF